MRIDKWLWAARFFKTRALATRACELGRIRMGDQACKASRDLRVGDKLVVTNEAGEMHIEILGLSAMRGPASVAQALYEESAESKARRQQVAEEKRAMFAEAPTREGRPSKRDRRELDRFRGRGTN